jgi:hypothetical protein
VIRLGQCSVKRQLPKRLSVGELLGQVTILRRSIPAIHFDQNVVLINLNIFKVLIASFSEQIIYGIGCYSV